MVFGKREPRSWAARRRGAFRPAGDGLEARMLLAVDIGGSTPPNLPNMATAPLGIDMAGGATPGGAGFSVADVGDVNGDGYDDFVVGAPTVVNQGGEFTPGFGNISTAYLVFGSRTTNAAAISDWLANNATQRVGDLSQLGNTSTSQQNPINGLQGFPFDGIKFTTSQQPGSQLGASVAPAGVINGTPAFLLGAPGGRDVNGNNAFTGRAYLIYGGAALNNVSNKAIDLDTPASYNGVQIVTFVGSGTNGAQIGRAVAGVGDVITDGLNDIAIGAPGATVNGLANAGAVFVVDGTGIPSVTSTVLLTAVGQTGGPTGVIFTGTNSGDQAGWSVAPAGDVDGAITTANQRIQDILIGAPQTNTGTGLAYLVYGGNALTQLAVPVSGLNQIQLSRVGASATGGVAGLAVQGTAVGDRTGWSVSSAGDFNSDGLSDILIGSPGYANSAGRADLIYGLPASGTPLAGQVVLDNLPTNALNATLVGANAGDLAGYAVASLGSIQLTRPGTPIAIGAPGFNNSAGSFYVIPSNDLEGRFSLAAVAGQPVAGTQFTITTPNVPGPAFLGASISGAQINLAQKFTADSDLLADFVVGAPGYSATVGRGLAGGAFIFEGAFVAPLLQVPISTLITTTLGGVDTFGNFNVNATTPANVQLYVLSNANTTPAFDPVRDIDPKTVVVNGVAFPNATVAKDPVDENNDGIEDAIITINPRSSLALNSNTTTMTVTGRTLAGSPNANRRWVAQAGITVAGGGGGGGGNGSLVGSLPVGFLNQTTFVAPFGPDVYVPSLTTLSTLSSYKPIPAKVALHQFLPEAGFLTRTDLFYHPRARLHQFGYSDGGGHNGRGTTQLGSKVFTREKYKPGRVFNFTHPELVVPVNLQRERFGSPGVSFHPVDNTIHGTKSMAAQATPNRAIQKAQHAAAAAIAYQNRQAHLQAVAAARAARTVVYTAHAPAHGAYGQTW